MANDKSSPVSSFLERNPPPEVLRIFRAAVHPDDVDEVIRLFEQEVRPAFSSLPSCLSIELVMDRDVSSTGLIEGAVVSRWKSLEEMEEGIRSDAALESQTNIRRLLRSQPIVTVHLVIA